MKITKAFIVPVLLMLWVCVVTYLTFFEDTHEDTIMVQDKPLSSYEKFRVREVLYDIDTTGDRIYDTQFLYVRPSKWNILAPRQNR